MAKQKNAVWRFFASVKLALIVLFILAATSIIGTLIKQGQTPAEYVAEYGPDLARILTALDFTNMYSSWWYVALLCLFAVNLLVCSMERLPAVWHMVMLDNLQVAPQNLAKMSCCERRETNLSPADTVKVLRQALDTAGWKNPQQLAQDGSTLLFSQKGTWTRLGVYVVHLSILVVLLGAIIGTLFGFQAYVFLPEGRSTSHIFLRQNKEPFPLGFELRCDRFEKTFYPSGMVKEYRSDLTVLDPELDAPYQKSIVVNDPLSYKGLTFYQGDSFPTQEFFVKISHPASATEQVFRVPPERDAGWPGTDLSFRIEELKLDQDGVASEAKISLTTTASAEPAIAWIADKGNANIRHAGQEFNISFRQYHSTLLLITKDPGVLIVYLGCLLMVLGLGVSFFLSHRRIWIQITPRGKQGSQILLSGGSNKNKPGFEQSFQKLVNQAEQTLTLSAGKKKP